MKAIVISHLGEVIIPQRSVIIGGILDYRIWGEVPRHLSTADLVPALEGKFGDGYFVYDPRRMDPK